MDRSRLGDSAAAAGAGDGHRRAHLARQVQLSQASRILWVDDRPSNNTLLIDSFETLGIHVDIALNTDAALELVKVRRYDVIISDMGRPPDSEAGYTFLRELRARNSNIPYIIYAGSGSSDHRKAAIQRGAIASTNDPQEVFRLVTTLIQQKAIADAVSNSDVNKATGHTGRVPTVANDEIGRNANSHPASRSSAVTGKRDAEGP